DTGGVVLPSQVGQRGAPFVTIQLFLVAVFARPAQQAGVAKAAVELVLREGAEAASVDEVEGLGEPVAQGLAERRFVAVAHAGAQLHAGAQADPEVEAVLPALTQVYFDVDARALRLVEHPVLCVITRAFALVLGKDKTEAFADAWEVQAAAQAQARFDTFVLVEAQFRDQAQ